MVLSNSQLCKLCQFVVPRQLVHVGGSWLSSTIGSPGLQSLGHLTTQLVVLIQDRIDLSLDKKVHAKKAP